MRVGKKANVVDAKKTRSCVVRLEKVSKISSTPSISPALDDSDDFGIRGNRLNATAMGATPKGRRGGPTSNQEEKMLKGPIKKRPVGGNSSQITQQKSASANMSNIRLNQKIKSIPRPDKTRSASTSSRDETPPPTIAAGRSRRAIKPNPKYASEDVVTPKVVRNVALSGDTGKSRNASTSSEDFYNRDSDDDFENEINEEEDDDDDDNDVNDLHNDKVYRANEKDQQDSDFSEIEEQPVRLPRPRPRGRPRKTLESSNTTTQHQANTKLATQTPTSNIKRTTVAANSASLRSAPSQLQQIRRSLSSVNAQRNLNLLSGSSTAQKRKLEETQDSSDNESSFTISRKQLLLSNSAGLKVKVPVRENKINATSTPLMKGRILGMQKLSTNMTSQQHQTLNGGSRINNSQTTSALPSRRVIEISAKHNAESTAKSSSLRSISIRQSVAATMANQTNKTQSSSAGTHQRSLTTQSKMFTAKTGNIRRGSPKPSTQKDTSNTITSISSVTGTSPLNNSSKPGDKSKNRISQNSAVKKATISTKTITAEKTVDLKDESPNSTMDDFETMPTFTIVNVNDIINKKGDVLITKTKNSNKKAPTVIEFSESISLEDDNYDEDDELLTTPSALPSHFTTKKLPKLPTLNNRKEFENKKSSLARSNESMRKLPAKPTSSSSSTKAGPQILNHKLGLRNSRVTPKTTTTIMATLTSPDKPAPRILNSMVAKKTQPVKPMIANMDDSADESFPLSLDEEEETEDEVESKNPSLSLSNDKKRAQRQRQMELDIADTESQNTEDDTMVQTSASASTAAVALTPKTNTNTVQQRRRRVAGAANTPIAVSSNKKRMTPAASKENSLAATNQRVNETKASATTMPLPRKANAEKVVISRQGDKIIKKITCFETWYVISMPLEPKRQTVIKNQFEMPLIRLANNAKTISLPTELWTFKVTLYELSPQTLAKTTFATYTGDLTEQRISEEDRGKYQPSCVMFRRSIDKNQTTRMPYDRAVIFKNKTFYTNIEGKNVRLVGAPSIISSESEIEILLEVVDALTLQSEFVEHISIVQ